MSEDATVLNKGFASDVFDYHLQKLETLGHLWTRPKVRLLGRLLIIFMTKKLIFFNTIYNTEFAFCINKLSGEILD